MLRLPAIWAAWRLLPAGLRGEGQLRQALAAGGFHHGDDGLVAGLCVGADDDDAALARRAGGTAEGCGHGVGVVARAHV